jgi:drug/metabolite transporter (DMT)-like permease
MSTLPGSREHLASPAAGVATPRAAEGDSYGRGVAMVLGATLFWSLAGVIVRLMDGAAGWEIAFWRALTLGITILVVVVFRYRSRLLVTCRQAGWSALAAGFFSAFAGMFYLLSLQHITVANALFMSGFSPLVAAMVGRWFLGEPVAPATWVAMGIALVGIGVMVDGAVALGRLGGNLLALCSSICFGLFGVMLRRGRQIDMMPSILASALITTLVAGGVLLARGIAVGDAAAGFSITAHDLLLCCFLGAVQQGVGTTLFTRGARSVPAAQLQLFATCEMLLGPTWAWLVVSEVPAGTTLIGGGLVLLAMLVQGRYRNRPP